MAKHKEQNFSNHIRLVPGYHYLTYGIVGAGLSLTCYWACTIPFSTEITAVLVLNSLALGLGLFYSRLFALRAQDRAIRAEENFRYFILTGKRLPVELRLGQIIALRFASDEEFVELVDEALEQNLKSKQIKMAIKNWRGDYHRV